MTSFMQKENEEREKRNPPYMPSPFSCLYEKGRKERTRLPLSIAVANAFFFLQQKTKKRKEKENPCCISSSLLYGKSDGKSFPLFFLKQEREKTGNKAIIPYLIFPSGRRTYKRGIGGSHYVFFSSLENEKKKEENTSIHTRKSFSFKQKKKKKEKKKKATMNLPSHLRTETGERTDSFFKKKKKERNECLSLLPFVRCRRRKKNG